MRVARLGAVLLVLSWYGRPAGAQTPAFQEHRQDVATLVTSEIEAFTGHVDNHCGIFTLPESLDGPPAVTRKEIGAALRCVRAAQRRGEAAWAVWQQGGVDATLFQGVAASKVSAVHLVQSEGNVGGVRLTPCLRPEIRKDGTIDCGVTPPATGRDLRKAVGRLAHDVEVTGGLSRSAVAALAEEYSALGPEVVGSSDPDEIFRLMREDPALHYTDAADMVRDSEEAMVRAWAAMPEWFETLPQAPCGVSGVTTGPKAYYYPPATDGSRGGTFFVNVSTPSSWGTFELESMAFHEGIPGHHLQLTVASELGDDVPEIRKHLPPDAYAEGWGLYTERLADEMGLYSSPLARIGMLSADSIRACRLVVDTGIHAFGWSRERAVHFMLDNSPLTEGVVRPEIDRYIQIPGQATSYMVGRVEIQRIRREAMARLGSGFDIKAFHTAVLAQGGLPLDVLEREVVAAIG